MFDELVPKFLESPEAYEQARVAWRRIWFDDVVGIVRARAAGWEEPWYEPVAPELEAGNSIFNAVNRTARKGIRIIQFSAPPRPIPTWGSLINVWFDDAGDDPVIRELVIDCVLTRATSMVAATLMRAWVAADVGPPDEFDDTTLGLLHALRTGDVVAFHRAADHLEWLARHAVATPSPDAVANLVHVIRELRAATTVDPTLFEYPHLVAVQESGRYDPESRTVTEQGPARDAMLRAKARRH